MRRYLLYITIAASLAFFLMTYLVKKDVLRRTDFNLTVKVQDRVPVRFDDNFVHVVDLGSMEIQTSLILVTILLISVSKRTKVLLTVAYIAGLAVTLGGKTFLPQPAPPYAMQRGAQGFSFPSSHVQVDASYPSGHTYRVIFLASLLCGSYVVSQKKTTLHLGLAIASVGFAMLVLTGLVLLGKHWSTDVIGGIFLSVSLVFGSLYLTYAQK